MERPHRFETALFERFQSLSIHSDADLDRLVAANVRERRLDFTTDLPGPVAEAVAELGPDELDDCAGTKCRVPENRS